MDSTPTPTQAQRLARAARFASPSTETPISNSPKLPTSAAATPIIIGTCTSVEKSYVRLTRAPDASTVRPVRVLRRALELVQQRWRAATAADEWYTSQLKSIRQDLTVQAIDSPFTVRVYETHARIALELADLASFQQCLSQIRSLARQGVVSSMTCQYEFLAYEIIHVACASKRVGVSDTCVDDDSSAIQRSLPAISALIAECSCAERAHPYVAHAIAVAIACASLDFMHFFQLYTVAPNMGACVMEQRVRSMRAHAAHVFAVSHRAEPPFQLLFSILCFKSPTDTDWLDFVAALSASARLRQSINALVVGPVSKPLSSSSSSAFSLAMAEPAVSSHKLDSKSTPRCVKKPRRQ